MPNSRSAKKRVKQDTKRRTLNREQRSELRTQVKKLRAAVAAGDAEASRQELRRTVKALDQAAAKGLIHKNTAARVKSRLTRSVNAVPASSDA